MPRSESCGLQASLRTSLSKSEYCMCVELTMAARHVSRVISLPGACVPPRAVFASACTSAFCDSSACGPGKSSTIGAMAEV